MVKKQVSTIYMQGDYSDRDLIDFRKDILKEKSLIFGMTHNDFSTYCYYFKEQFRHRSFTDKEAHNASKKILTHIEKMKELKEVVSLENLKKHLLRESMDKEFKNEK